MAKMYHPDFMQGKEKSEKDINDALEMFKKV